MAPFFFALGIGSGIAIEFLADRFDSDSNGDTDRDGRDWSVRSEASLAG
jgi:hypothetical protein